LASDNVVFTLTVARNLPVTRMVGKNINDDYDYIDMHDDVA